MAFVHHTQTLLIKLPHFVFQPVFLLDKFIETVIQRASAHSLSHMVYAHIDVAAFQYKRHKTFIAHEELRHHYGVEVVIETKTAVHHFAWVYIDHTNPVITLVHTKIQHTPVQTSDWRNSGDVILLRARCYQSQGESYIGKDFHVTCDFLLLVKQIYNAFLENTRKRVLENTEINLFYIYPCFS